MLGATEKCLSAEDTICGLIERHALVRPDAIAVSYQGVHVSYKQLNEKSNQIAHFLKMRGVGPEVLVGVGLSRSIEMIMCVLAVLKAGGAYVPIDLNYPEKHINYILSDAKISLLLTKKSLLATFSKSESDIVYLDDLFKNIDLYPRENLINNSNQENLAYVLYTSGSTGKPKGVMITRGNLSNAYFGWYAAYGLKPSDNHLQMASFSFDVFSGDFVRALCSGGTLVLCPYEMLFEPASLYRLLKQEAITCAEFVPAVLRKLYVYVETVQKSLDFMRILICGSDNWSLDEYKKIQQHCGPSTRIINSYGLTEATIDSTYFEFASFRGGCIEEEKSVPIGRPFQNTKIYLLDDQLKPVPKGEVGEMYISGPSVARGYYNNPALTAERFITHTFDGCSSGIRLYKTGDLGRYLPNDDILFLGRIDHQIKWRGFRIELNAIENVLNLHPLIEESAVVAHGDTVSDHRHIVAYLVLSKNIILGVREVRKFLSSYLPYYMVPNIFVALEALPLTPNGKLDRAGLGSGRFFASSKRLTLETHYLKPKSVNEIKLSNILKGLLKIKKIGVNDDFIDLGLDSLSQSILCLEIENVFNVKIPFSEMGNFRTISDLSCRIDSIYQKRKFFERSIPAIAEGERI